MNRILKSISYIFHPIFMPLIAVVFYMTKVPRFLPQALIKAKLFPVILLTVVLPILLFFLLKNAKKVSSIYLKTPKERLLPLALFSIIIMLIIKRVFPSSDLIELHYFFVGVLASVLGTLILALLRFKASIHMVASMAVLVFIIGLSIHFSKNYNGSIALFFIIVGAIGTSRLHLRAHTFTELLIGSTIGAIPQILVFNYWL